MRLSAVSCLVTLSVLAACSGGRDDDHIKVCQQQSDLARNGKMPSGQIAISCPAHGIGDYR